MSVLASHFPYLVAAWVFLWGLYGIVSSKNFVHLVVCLAVLQTSSYVLLVAIGYVNGAGAPVWADVPPSTPAVDPIVQALMLTDVVVEATVIALLLALAIKAQQRAGTLDPDELRPMRG